MANSVASTGGTGFAINGATRALRMLAIGAVDHFDELPNFQSAMREGGKRGKDGKKVK